MLLYLLIAGVALAWGVILLGCWLGWQLLRQNGRLLLRLEDLEQRLNQLEFDEAEDPAGLPVGSEASGVDLLNQDSVQAQSASNGDGREARFNNRSLARSKIKRDGLKAGTPAPDFRLPRLDGRGDLSLAQLRGRRLLLVFSSPSCGPCLMLAPELEKFHRGHPELDVVMISKGEPKENRAKVKEHRLTFPIALQQQWEISRRYAMFATPIAYLIDEAGVIMRDVAVGTDAILGLLAQRNTHVVP